MTVNEYYEWFRQCGYERTGNGTTLTEEWRNANGFTIYVNRPETLSEEDRVDATRRMSQYFGWRSEWGAH